jgi:hypothetical protein
VVVAKDRMLRGSHSHIWFELSEKNEDKNEKI